MIETCLIALNYRDFETTSEFIKKIKNYSNIDKIVVVDNDSNDLSYEKLKKFSNEKIHVIKSDKNGGYGYGNNYGMRYAIKYFNPKFFIISNCDVYFEENIVSKLIETYKGKENIACVSPLMIDNNTESFPAWKIPSFLDDIISNTHIGTKIINKKLSYNNLNNEVLIVDTLPGSFFIIPRFIMEEIKFFDEEVFLYCEERILAKKIKEIGYKNILLTNINYYHNHSTCINKNIKSITKQNEILLNSKKIYHRKYNNKNNFYIFLLDKSYYIYHLENKILNYLKKIIRR